MPVTVIGIIKLLVLPPGLFIILALLGLVYQERRFGLSLLSVSLLCLLLLSLPVVVDAWANLWERFSPVQEAQIRQSNAQALVVIGGGVESRAAEYDVPFTVNTRTLVRLRYAAKLAAEFELPVLVSGGRISADSAVSEALLMARVMKDEFNIPVAWQEQKSRNTAENARFSAALLRRYGIRNIVLVTQAYHMPRAVSEFVKAGVKVLPAPTAFIGRKSEMSIFDFLPSPTALMNGFLLSHECVGMLWYAVRY